MQNHEEVEENKLIYAYDGSSRVLAIYLSAFYCQLPRPNAMLAIHRRFHIDSTYYKMVQNKRKFLF